MYWAGFLMKYRKISTLTQPEPTEGEVMILKLRRPFLILLFMIFSVAGCQSEGGGGKEGGKGNNQKAFLATITTELSIQEKDDLLFMWE